MSASDLSRGDLVAIGLEDLAAGAETVPAPPNTVCTRCSPRWRGRSALALIHRLVSFERAAERVR